MGKTKTDQLFGSLDLLVLRVLDSGERLHGYAITERIRACSDALRVEEGSLYPALHRMDEARWVSSEWGISDNNRRAKFYRLTKAGPKQLDAAVTQWAQAADIVARFVALKGQKA